MVPPFDETGSSATNTCPKWAINAMPAQERMAFPARPQQAAKLLLGDETSLDVSGMVRHGRERIPATIEAK